MAGVMLSFPVTIDVRLSLSRRVAGIYEKNVVVVRIGATSKSAGVRPELLSRGAAVRGRRAFTLIEVIVSMALLTSMVIALYAAYSFGFGTIKLSQEDLRADQIMVQKLETLRMYDWSKITNGYLPTNFFASFSTNGGIGYHVTISVSNAPIAESYSNTLRQVTVTLDWFSVGVQRNRSMTTLVSENGLQTYRP
jgi:prepilin-type N-terminal cleavage/methylation domain-containing protein